MADEVVAINVTPAQVAWLRNWIPIIDRGIDHEGSQLLIAVWDALPVDADA